MKLKSRGNLTAPSKPNKSRLDFTLARPEVTVFLPEAWDLHNTESWVSSNLTRTPPDSSDDEERTESPSLPEQKGTQFVSNNKPQKSFSAKMIDTQRKVLWIESEGVANGNYFSRKTGRHKRYKRRKQRQTKRKDMMSLRFNPKKRQQQKKPYLRRCITKGRAKETLKETKGSTTAEPVRSIVDKKKTLGVSIIEDRRQKIALRSKKGGPISNGPPEEPINALKRKDKQNCKGRKKKKKKRPKKWRPPKKVKA